MDTAVVDRLARLRGLGEAYHDYRGELQYFSAEAKTSILRAMGCAVDDAEALAKQLRELEATTGRRLLPLVAAARGVRIGFDLNITAKEFGASLHWVVHLENGERCEGNLSTTDCREVWRGEIDGTWITRRRFELPVDLPGGYHELEAFITGGSSGRCSLVISPRQCYEPAAINDGRRLWGVAVQLYTVRSRKNWGIGDFADLKTLLQWVAPHGAGFIGLNPLHALAPADPQRSSPYSASSRHFINILYIAVPAVPGFCECNAVQERFGNEEFQDRLRAVRATPLVDYAAVADLKFEMLELLFRDFGDRHLAKDSVAARRFYAFVASGGALLETHALFDALDQHCRVSFGCASGWLSWPHEFRDLNGSAARGFAAQYPMRVQFYLYLQWLAHEQLAEAQALARGLKMPIGIYGDYAVGSNPSGSETWGDFTNYRMGAEIGAPPDPLALKGQGWGIPPQDPVAMEEQRLQVFLRLIRNNMRYYGALRLDHVMSLFRLWWVAAGHSPSDGVYVHYPLHQLMTVLALESCRNSCLVVGEDLGVVPDEMRRAMPEFGVYHYKVMLFEKLGNRFRRPDEYERRALATVTTHDMPTLRSWWDGLDIELRRGLNLYPSAAIEADVCRERHEDRATLLDALGEQGLRPAAPHRSGEAFTPELAHAMHTYLARSQALLVALQIEDLLGMVDPVNVPGTDREYPNWQRKLTMDLEEVVERPDYAGYLADIQRARVT